MNRKFTALIAALVLTGGACLAVADPGPAVADSGAGAWTQSSNGLSLDRYSFRATTLTDGRVLVEGGFAPGSYTTETEIYDPATNTWTVASPMHQGRGEQTATLLADGRVLVAGGYAGPVLSSAEIFDPSSSQWQVTGSMNVNRTRQAAVRLCDGRVLVVGGWNGQELTSAEIYDPSSGTWAMTQGSLAAPVSGLEAFLLRDCTVLVAGGGNGSVPSAAAYIFHPDTGTFTAITSMNEARAGFSGVELPDGHVLVMGGNTAGSETTAEEFDPATQQWSEVAPMHDPHTLGTGEEAQLLPGGQVLLPGDNANGLEAELYDPAANTWSFTGPQNAAHYGGATALLNDGRVLNAGGMDSSRTLTAVSETYKPAPNGQVISFTPPASGTYGGSATLTATGGSSGSPVVFTVDPSSTSGACAVSGTNGSTLGYTGTGNCVIDANEAGGNGYGPAPQVQQAIAVNPAPLTVTASSAAMTWGAQAPAITPSYSGFAAGDSPANLTTPPSCTTTASSSSPLGSDQSSTCSGAVDPDYQISYVQGKVTVALGNYVSMGDSYSSGEGNSPYIQGTDTASDKCHRSILSYPEMLVAADLLSQTGTHTYVACSGAETYDFLNPNHKNPSEKAQVASLSAKTNVVTFTIGGNDIGFADVLTACSHVSDLLFASCSKNANLTATVNTRIAALHGQGTADDPDHHQITPIQKLLLTIHQDAPNAAIFVAGYPHLFGQSALNFQADKNAPSKYVCKVGSLPGINTPVMIDYADTQWLNTEADALDNAISAAVKAAQDDGVRVTYVGTVPGLFNTHGLCDSAAPWIHNLTFDALSPDPGSFHPTQDGQQDGYESAFSRQ